MLCVLTIRIATAFFILTALTSLSLPAHAHAVLLMEEPYGFFGQVFPTGHSAIYFEQICAETPTQLRRCRPGELGSVITRDPGVPGHEWVAIPLVPYLYAVENPAEVPSRVDSHVVWRMRLRYHERHLLSLGEKVTPGDLFRGGWALLVGMSYERRMYAFSFETTAEQDDALIRELNTPKGPTRFNFLYNNCSDFARTILNIYFPHSFRRDPFADAGITTPKSITRELVRFARKHPEMELRVFEIPQVPGLRGPSHPNKSVTESLATTAYAIPIALASPFVAGGIFVDYLIRGRFHLIPRDHSVVAPNRLVALTAWNSPSPAVGGATAAAADLDQAQSDSAESSPDASDTALP